MTTRIGVALFDGVEELDFAGPWEVLASWAHGTDDDVEIVTVSQNGGEVRCAKGLRVVPDHGWDDCPALDVLVYPGGNGTRAHLDDESVLDWVRARADDADIVLSVCTGSLVLAAAGLLDGRPATTHWSALDRLAELAPTAEVRRGARYCDSGDIITAAGVSAGIDAALHLIVRLSGEQRAREIKRYIQYDPAPPV